MDGFLFRESGSGRAAPTPPTAIERDARARKRRGAAGFETALLLEVAGTDFEAAKALLWRLTDATDSLADAGQEIRWKVVRGAVASAPDRSSPTGSSRSSGICPTHPSTGPAAVAAPARRARRRPPAGRLASSSARTASARWRSRLAILAAISRVVGATGSGKSTLLLNLALGLLETGMGTTVIDPHGDLVADILCRIPRSRRAGPRPAPRRPSPSARLQLPRAPDRPSDDQLVASEFVYLLEDLWPRFSGPKMQHYLRNALLTLLDRRARRRSSSSSAS